MTDASYDVRFWRIEERDYASARYRVRWKVAGRIHRRSFAARALAEAFRAQLQEAARKGESFSTETGLPQSLIRHHRDVTCYEHAEEFVAATWPSAAAKSRISVLETLSVALPVLARDVAGRPTRMCSGSPFATRSTETSMPGDRTPPSYAPWDG